MLNPEDLFSLLTMTVMLGDTSFVTDSGTIQPQVGPLGFDNVNLPLSSMRAALGVPKQPPIQALAWPNVD